MNAVISMPLSLLMPGERARVARFPSGEEAQKRLAGMGIRPGCEIEIMLCSGDQLVLALDHARIALPRALAQKILVSSV
ncbi:MAG: ferrous iron transport protein A [Zoogloeaceae bacterium]|jgi:Fe2+ transport system protein FeoA|nr:ferrous iron transport protein A [Zoogloeaceae bacterium]